MISCTGTNFIIRADAGQMVDWFPTYTLGEDMALALALEKAGYCVSLLLPAACNALQLCSTTVFGGMHALGLRRAITKRVGRR